MANPDHLAKLKEDVEGWNEWRLESLFAPVDLGGADLGGSSLENADLSESDLSETDLSDASLRYAKFRNSKLVGANLQNADLSYSDLCDADLRNTVLIGANLTSAEFTNANLTGARLTAANLEGAGGINANLSGAWLLHTNLKKAELHHANLTGAIVGGTFWADLDLSRVKGLESITHGGPSTIGLDTLYKSKGQIPEIFLRGCGVPDSFITQMKSLIGAEEGIQFYSCFISYSGKDEDFAKRLHARLQQDHVRVWFAPEDIQGGKKLHEQIDEAIRIYDKLLIVLSPHSLTSEWVLTELRKARKAERKTGKRKLFPIRLVDYETLTDWECFDADSGKCLATEVREYFIPDFTQWKDHDAFEAAYARLLKDLRGDT